MAVTRSRRKMLRRIARRRCAGPHLALVDRERLNARRIVAGVRLSDIHGVVLRLAALTATDLSVPSVTDSEAKDANKDNDPGPPTTEHGYNR
jgi:hypothetical protein